MVTTVDVSILAPPLVPTAPKQTTLDLFTQYDHPFPGAQVIAPGLRLATFIAGPSDPTTADKIQFFLASTYGKLRPNNYSPTALYQVVVATGTAVQSTTRGFYTVSDNDISSIIPPQAAKPVNAALTGLEKTYNEGALNYLLTLFDAHAADTIDNPHHDQNLFDATDDFYRILYNEYLTLGYEAITLDTFIALKTTPLAVATLASFGSGGFSYLVETYQHQPDGSVVVAVYPHALLVAATADTTVVPALIFKQVLDQHNTSTDPSIHANSLQAVLSGDIILPAPMISLVPELYFDLYVAATSGSPFFYNTALLYDEFPRLYGTLYVQADLDTSGASVVNVVQFANSGTSDSLSVHTRVGVSNGVAVVLSFGGVTYTQALSNVITQLVMAVSFSPTGLQFSYLDQTGTLNTATIAISNLHLEFDRITVGLPIQRPTTGTPYVLQQLAVYPSQLSSDAITLLFDTIFP